MKKKLINCSCLLVIITLSIAGCSKVLDKKPIGEIDAATIDDPNAGESITATEAEQLLSGAYNDMYWDGEEYWAFDRTTNGDAMADNCYAGSDNPANHAIDLFTTNSLNGNVERNWSRLYTSIGKINETIDKVSKATDPALTAERKNRILGEARALRAANYFELVRLWGDVPLILQPIVTTDTKTIFESVAVPRSAAAAVYDSIIADLEFAVANVRTASQAASKQIMNTGIVNTMLAKVYATVEPHDWNKVNQYCDAVIADGYTLLPDYDFLFDGQHKSSSESIWEITYEGWGSGTYGLWIRDMYIGGGWPKFNTPSHDLVRAFEAEGDNVRLNSSIQWVDYSGQWVDPYWPMNNLPLINKVRGGDVSSFIIYRFADILLLKAEALTELNQLDDGSGAQFYLNKIRNRVGLANTTATTQAALRLAIEKERQLELAFEGYRWFDLQRTGRTLEVMRNAKKANNEPLNYPIQEFRLLFPVPQNEMDRNPRLTQNPGY
ncbi:RagB/SusD family nutrient uptake outer membrane protein [Agriterribacter sp.]|uniref:RagB/SusD family nutrient uptake outer membrane protein n=1 Tax=Agriterribacter sp. TaxID=2821509 RepID=UPI002BB8EB67|nr:RagB/SusD family nutrient uptake outer membrane protein [Agriterribacter sp.]HTN07110.1 RagB/SusD family nutrient uptake outer membrane protein [Agriterribacter sp.]